MTKVLAKAAIEAFASRATRPAFTLIQREIIVESLKYRVDNPEGIYQGNFSGLCGPAALSYEIAKHRPLDYVNAVISLYETGSAWLGKWQLKPCVALKHAVCPMSNPAADWILLASIRDSENWFFDYVTDKYDDEKHHPYLSFLSGPKGAGTFASEMVSMMTNIGFTDVNSSKSLTNFFDKRKILFESIDYYNRDYQVLWLTNADIIDGVSVDSRLGHANHFVALAGDFKPPANDTWPMKVPIFTWGEIIHIPKKGDMPYKDFLSGFFGYVTGRL